MTDPAKTEEAIVAPWVRRLNVPEFTLLNWSWLGKAPDTKEAIRRFEAEGVPRLAPVAFSAAFDPEYYREVHPEYAELDDEAVYRRWLFIDLEKNWPGSAGEHLRNLGLDLDRYPEGFDWRGYVRSEEIVENRWFALQHLLDGGAPERGFPAQGAGAATFAMAMGLAYRVRDDRSAAIALAHARWRGDRSYFVAHQLADVYLRAGEWRKALRLYQEAAAHPDAGEVWTYANGASAAVRLGAFRAAIALLEAGKHEHAGHQVWRRAVAETVEALFSARSARVRGLYERPEGRERADRLISDLLDRVHALWERLDPIGTPLEGASDRRVVFLASFDIPACTHYRVEQKAEMLRALGIPYEVYRPEEWAAFISALPGAAAAVIFRLPAWPTVMRAIGAAREMGVPTFYDIDDLIFDSKEYPEPLESYGGLLAPGEYEAILFGTPLFRKALSLCDYGITPTSSLAKAMEPVVRTHQVFVLANALDSRNDPFLALPPREQGEAEVRIIYASGTKAHNTDWDTLAGPAVLSVMEAHPHVRLMVAGHLTLAPEFRRLGDRVTRITHIDSMSRFWSVLAEAHVNLAVLRRTWATDAKSEIKWLEAAVLGVPSVVSATATYREIIEDGRDGLLADTPEDWRAALEKLVCDPGLRASIGQAARAKASELYALPVNAARFQAALAVADEKPPATKARPRIVLCNVWFPPQASGGATRVVVDNLDSWLDAGLAAEFDFVVIAADDGGDDPYAVRVDSHRGVPVFRITAPRRVGEDWAFEDAGMRRVFDGLLRFLGPDLVHFHAVQRLTASVAEACREAGVPYLVTVHDAWWISDWHFLVDSDGKTVEPTSVAPARLPAGAGPATSRVRAQRLRSALEAAEGVLAVSRTFGDIYRRCGFTKVLDVPNGVSPMAVPARTRSPSGRVRLAHVGNVAWHKGHQLVEAALRQSRFDRLEVTVVHHGRPPGHETEMTWGATPVRVVGHIPPARIGEFYANLDVLLAPSIWPESFGLVAREALQAGCRVVASDRGAIGEDVTDGVNGFVIDVSGVDGLIEVLRTINDDPARFLEPPESRPVLRTAAEQAGDLIAVYRKVLGGEPLLEVP